MDQANLSLIWWNTSLSPPINRKSGTKNKFKHTRIDRILYCTDVVQQFMDADYDFICLGEVNSEDIKYITEKTNIVESDYTFINGFEKVGSLVFDTCILFKKSNKLNADASQVRNLTYSVSGRNIKVAQRFEFFVSNVGETIVLYLSHWPSNQSADDRVYQGIAQDLRGAVNNDLLYRTSHIVLLGDYNVEPHHTSMVEGLQASREKDLVIYRKSLLYNPCWKFLTRSQNHTIDGGKPSTYYLRKTGLFNSWHMIDQVLISYNFLTNAWNFKDSFVEIIDTNTALNDPISDHLAISIFIERA